MPEEEYLAIKNLCQKYGYGNVMTMASALWEFELLKENAPVEMGFIPVLRSTATSQGRKMAEQSLIPYRSIIVKYEHINLY